MIPAGAWYCAAYGTTPPCTIPGFVSGFVVAGSDAAGVPRTSINDNSVGTIKLSLPLSVTCLVASDGSTALGRVAVVVDGAVFGVHLRRDEDCRDPPSSIAMISVITVRFRIIW